MTVFIPMFQPSVSEDAVARVAECLRSGWLGQGAAVPAFEHEFARTFGFDRALAVNSGTAALHLALLSAHVGPGDEVITTAQTFIATALVILYVGARPVFADVVPGGPNLDPEDVERRVTSRTKAVIVVHYGGYPCDMEGFKALSARHNLVVVEDAAHALGATYQGDPVGSLGDFGAFSFQAIKQLTTADGGMLVCAREDAHEEALRRRWFGIDRQRRQTTVLGEPEWDVRELGYKYHMNDVTASFGLGQLPGFAAAQARRRYLARVYREELLGVDGLSLLEERPDRENACWLFTVRVRRRPDFVRAMRARGVEAAVWHRRIDVHSIFGGVRRDLPNLAAFDETQVALPLRESMTDAEAETVVRAVRAGW